MTKHMRNNKPVNTSPSKAINIFFNKVGRKLITRGNVQGALEELDEAVDALNSKLATSDNTTFVKYINDGTVVENACHRYGNTVNVGYRQHSISGATASGKVLAVPNGYVPKSTRYVMGYIVVGSTNYPTLFSVESNGNITIGFSTSQKFTQFCFAGSYEID